MPLLALITATALMAPGTQELRVLLTTQDSLRVVPAAGEQLQVLDAAGRSLGVFARGVSLQGTPAGIEGLGRPHQLLWIRPRLNGSSLWLQQRRYRGLLKLQSAQGRVQVINRVALPDYLASVVGAEMPHHWPAAALQVQAVASRTYALRQRQPSADYDLGATISSQVYRGVESETPSTREAVASTRHQVLTHQGRLIDAVFHSSSGGVTENSGEIWRYQLPYLKSVRDFDQSSPVHRWRQPLHRRQLQRAFAEIGGVDAILPLQRTSSGRLRQVLVRGPEGELQLSGSALRRRLKLRSSFVRFESPEQAGNPLTALQDWLGLRPQLMAIGRGWGHGVGLSQWGALAMSQRGSSYRDILSHYYKDTTVRALRPAPGWPLPPPPP